MGDANSPMGFTFPLQVPGDTVDGDAEDEAADGNEGDADDDDIKHLEEQKFCLRGLGVSDPNTLDNRLVLPQQQRQQHQPQDIPITFASSGPEAVSFSYSSSSSTSSSSPYSSSSATAFQSSCLPVPLSTIADRQLSSPAVGKASKTSAVGTRSIMSEVIATTVATNSTSSTFTYQNPNENQTKDLFRLECLAQPSDHLKTPSANSGSHGTFDFSPTTRTLLSPSSAFSNMATFTTGSLRSTSVTTPEETTSVSSLMPCLVEDALDASDATADVTTVPGSDDLVPGTSSLDLISSLVDEEGILGAVTGDLSHDGPPDLRIDFSASLLLSDIFSIPSSSLSSTPTTTSTSFVNHRHSGFCQAASKSASGLSIFDGSCPSRPHSDCSSMASTDLPSVLRMASTETTYIKTPTASSHVASVRNVNSESFRQMPRARIRRTDRPVAGFRGPQRRSIGDPMIPTSSASVTSSADYSYCLAGESQSTSRKNGIEKLRFSGNSDAVLIGDDAQDKADSTRREVCLSMKNGESVEDSLEQGEEGTTVDKIRSMSDFFFVSSPFSVGFFTQSSLACDLAGSGIPNVTADLGLGLGLPSLPDDSAASPSHSPHTCATSLLQPIQTGSISGVQPQNNRHHQTTQDQFQHHYSHGFSDSSLSTDGRLELLSRAHSLPLLLPPLSLMMSASSTNTRNPTIPEGWSSPSEPKASDPIVKTSNAGLFTAPLPPLKVQCTNPISPPLTSTLVLLTPTSAVITTTTAGINKSFSLSSLEQARSTCRLVQNESGMYEAESNIRSRNATSVSNDNSDTVSTITHIPSATFGYECSSRPLVPDSPTHMNSQSVIFPGHSSNGFPALQSATQGKVGTIPTSSVDMQDSGEIGSVLKGSTKLVFADSLVCQTLIQFPEPAIADGIVGDRVLSRSSNSGATNPAPTSFLIAAPSGSPFTSGSLKPRDNLVVSSSIPAIQMNAHMPHNLQQHQVHQQRLQLQKVDRETISSAHLAYPGQLTVPHTLDHSTPNYLSPALCQLQPISLLPPGTADHGTSRILTGHGSISSSAQFITTAPQPTTCGLRSPGGLPHHDSAGSQTLGSLNQTPQVSIAMCSGNGPSAFLMPVCACSSALPTVSAVIVTAGAEAYGKAEFGVNSAAVISPVSRS
ncbi:unnamed protein product [Protopolystoma xenopodis]|uniref:Uncharacterized protein n=1 Tax=Protopolystoma xenopodis TaxID=117903 RepID=A0A3S4ZAM4_9PLAT|nr:unnamed protein product [Protopolystoma xenopodis]